MKKKIVIAEYLSTGINLVYDVLSRGYEPVLLDCVYVAEKEVQAAQRRRRDILRATLPQDLIHIEENPDYEAVLAQVRALAPVLVIAGSEFGVPYANRLAADLGLPGNPVSRLKAMTEKDSMHEALRQAGVRHIRGRVVSSLEEAAAFYRELNTEDVVVKRVRGWCTQGVYLCKGLDSMLETLKHELDNGVQENGKPVPLLIQERIMGVEYIVNTVSCAGEHRMTSVWRYDKIRLPNKTNAHNHTCTVNKLDIGHSRLIRYAYDVLDAIGIQYGAVHGEYMIDEKGPVLIEVNCRPMGISLERQYVEQLFGHHETDCALDAYLAPEKFAADKHKPYRPLRFGAIKTFILPNDVEAESTPVVPISQHIRSYYSALFSRVGRELLLTRTKDLDTSGGTLYMLNDSEQQLMEDLDLLHTLEMRCPDILFQRRLSAEATGVPRADIQAIIRALPRGSETLVFSDDPHPIEGAAVIDETQLRGAHDHYDQGILDLSKPGSFADLEIVIRQIYEFADKLREGGRIIIPESTYCHLPYGMDGMEILLRISGLRIEAPLAAIKGALVASVEIRPAHMKHKGYEE